MPEHAEHITCQDVVELVTSYLEARLAPADAALFEEHIVFCDACEAYLDQMRATIATVGRIEETDVPADTRDQLLAAFRDWKRS